MLFAFHTPLVEGLGPLDLEILKGVFGDVLTLDNPQLPQQPLFKTYFEGRIPEKDYFYSLKLLISRGCIEVPQNQRIEQSLRITRTGFELCVDATEWAEQLSRAFIEILNVQDIHETPELDEIWSRLGIDSHVKTLFLLKNLAARGAIEIEELRNGNAKWGIVHTVTSVDVALEREARAFGTAGSPSAAAGAHESVPLLASRSDPETPSLQESVSRREAEPAMRVFVSWSGPGSHEAALALHEWLPAVVSGVTVWVSSEDIAKGSRWSRSLAEELDKSQFGILCITPTNLNEAWLIFEAGAISKSVQSGRVAPLLFGVDPDDLPGPIFQFQATRFNKEDVLKLVCSISEASDRKTPHEDLRRSFEKHWPSLNKRFSDVMEKIDAQGSDSSNDHSIAVPRALTDPELQVLRWLKDYKKPVSPKALGSQLSMDSNEAARILNRLFAMELVRDTYATGIGKMYSLDDAGTAYLQPPEPSNATEAPVRDELPSECTDVLNAIANVSGGPTSAVELSRHLNIPLERLNYFIDILLAKEMLYDDINSTPITYSLKPNGRKWLFEQGLL